MSRVFDPHNHIAAKNVTNVRCQLEKGTDKVTSLTHDHPVDQRDRADTPYATATSEEPGSSQNSAPTDPTVVPEDLETPAEAIDESPTTSGTTEPDAPSRMRETTKHRKAFRRYVRLGAGRSITKLQDALLDEDGEAPSTRWLYEWSSQFDWQARIDEIEADAREADRKRFASEHQERNRRHADQGQELQEHGFEALRNAPPEDITPAVALRLIDRGTEMERKARGLDEEELSSEQEPAVREVRVVWDTKHGDAGFKYVDEGQEDLLKKLALQTEDDEERWWLEDDD